MVDLISLSGVGNDKNNDDTKKVLEALTTNIEAINNYLKYGKGQGSMEIANILNAISPYITNINKVVGEVQVDIQKINVGVFNAATQIQKDVSEVKQKVNTLSSNIPLITTETKKEIITTILNDNIILKEKIGILDTKFEKLVALIIEQTEIIREQNEYLKKNSL